MSSISSKQLTCGAWLALPETMHQCDIVDGVTLIAPAPTPIHQWIMMEITVRLKALAEEKELGGPQYLETPPDLLAEVSSPSNSRWETGDRLGATGKSAWLNTGWSVQVLHLSPEQAFTQAMFGIDDTLTSEVLSDFSLTTRDI